MTTDYGLTSAQHNYDTASPREDRQAIEMAERLLDAGALQQRVFDLLGDKIDPDLAEFTDHGQHMRADGSIYGKVQIEWIKMELDGDERRALESFAANLRQLTEAVERLCGPKPDLEQPVSVDELLTRNDANFLNNVDRAMGM